METSVATHTHPTAHVLTETVVSLSQAARRLPPFRAGRPVNRATIFRWISEGVRLPDGSRLRLEAVRIGGRWVTSIEALTRFAESQTPAAPVGSDAARIRTPGQRQRASDQAGDELSEKGI